MWLTDMWLYSLWLNSQKHGKLNLVRNRLSVLLGGEFAEPFG